LDQYLNDKRGIYSVGDEITLADCFLFPQVSAAVDRYQIDLTAMKNLREVTQNLENVEAFIKAHPKNQPDYRPPSKPMSR